MQALDKPVYLCYYLVSVYTHIYTENKATLNLKKGLFHETVCKTLFD